VKIADIRIGNRFRRDLGDISTLAKSIQEIGLLQPIVVNEHNELIDGQRRIEAYRYLGWNEIPVHVVNIDELLKVKGELHANSVRKDFTVSERIAILEEIERRRLGHRQRKGSNLESFQKENKDKRSVDIVSKFTGASQGQLAKEKKIVEAARRNPEKYGIYLEKVDARKMRVDKAIRIIQNEENRIQAEEAANHISITSMSNSNDRCPLFKKSFPKITDEEISSDSTNLVYTDPPYDKLSLPIYDDLAKFASRTLVQNGSLVVVLRQSDVRTIIGYMEDAGLTWRRILAIKMSGPFPRDHYDGVVIKHKQLGWFTKEAGKREHLGKYVDDLISSSPTTKLKKAFAHAQSPIEAEYIISKLTLKNQIVCDPMMGSGTTGMASLKLNRKFIGIDKNLVAFKKAKANLANWL
jgi:16S rRNA G966 N2-methylase RsmD